MEMTNGHDQSKGKIRK